MRDVEPELVQWLWPQRFAVGKFSMVAGDPGLGKSFLTLDMVARVSTGSDWPDGTPNEQPGGVLLISCEDGLADTIRPRLDAAGADVDRIFALDEGSGFNFGDVEALEDWLIRIPDARLCVIDPLSSYLGMRDLNSMGDVRGMLRPICELAARHDVAIVAVHHLRKSTDGPAVHQGAGSIGVVAAARASYLVTKDRNDPSGRRRMMVPQKNNIGDDSTGMAFKLMTVDGMPQPCVAWEPDPILLDADMAMSAPALSDEVHDAADWLAEYLADADRLAADVLRDGQGDGHTEKSLRRALKAIGGKSQRVEYQGAYLWTLPRPDDRAKLANHPPHPET